ncbi:MAG: UvrD-helicase domain-containing protein [Syntrophomonas sp.]
MSLNAQQKLAVTELDKSMSISAGAGSGKTRMLVERFWSLVKSGQARVDEILAVTFTRKAAHELIDRVRKRIDESDWNEIQKMNLKENLSRAYIGTIHSFCTRLLKENPVEAGVDPYFRVIEELDGAQLLQQTVEEVVLNQVRADAPDILALVELVGYNPLCLELQTLTRILINKGLKLDGIEKTTWASLAVDEKQTLNRVIRINQSLAALAELLPEVDSKSKTFSAVQEIAANYKYWSSLAETIYTGESQELLNLLEHLQELCKQMKARMVKDQAEELKQALEELLGYLADRQTISSLEAVFRLLNMIAKSFHNYKDKENILEFSDLEEKAVSLLYNHPSLLHRYQKQFRHIMVDEFQDTNHRQAELVNLLAGGQHPGKLFIVGDPKQSIYRFRGAEVGLFAEISEQIENYGGLKHSLDENYRSRKQVIEIINNLFEKLMQVGGCQFQKLVAGRKNMLAHPQTEVHLLKQDSSSELERDEAEAECLALRIKEIVSSQMLVSEIKAGEETLRPVQYGDIALLYRTTRDMSTFATVFGNYGIPSYIVGSRGFYQTEEVRTVILALRVVANRGDELAWAGLLRSCLFGVSDEALWLMKQAESNLEGAITRLDSIVGIAPAEQSKTLLAYSVILNLRRLKSRLPLVELLDLLLERTGFEYALSIRPNGNQMIANLNKLKSIAASYNHENNSNLTGFLNFIAQVQEADIREPEAATETEKGDTVKMMTVHQAKGLEFPVVVIPEMHRKFNFRDISGFSVISEEYGVFLKTANHKGLLRQKAEAAERLKLEEEYKRLLYVAMTRARDYLILSGYYKIDSKGMVKTESSSWLNWLFAEHGVEEEPFTGQLEQAGLRVFNYLQADMSAAEQMSACQSPNRDENEIDRHQVNSIIAAAQEHLYRQVISATAVMDYSFCQRYYYLKHLAGIPETAAGEEYTGEIIVHNMRADKMGILVHRAIEQGDDLADAREVLKQLVQGIARDKNREMILNELDPMLVSYYENKSVQSLTAEYGVQKEVPFLARIDRYTYLKGFIDQLFSDTDRVVITDLKTSRINNPQQLGKKTQQYAVQLNVYEEAIRKILGVKDVDKKLLFLRTGEIVDAPTSVVELDLSGTGRTASIDDCKKCSYNRLCPKWPEQ